jgi:Spy/CpxP family protein refolding chaperone
MKLLGKRLVVIGVTVVCLALAGYGFGENQPPKPAPQDQLQHQGKPHKQSCLVTLQLDEKQKAEVKKIREAHKAEINNLRSELKSKVETLQNAMKSEDEQAIRKAFQDVSKVRENMLILRLSILKEIKNVLSDDQKAQFDSCIQQRFDKFHRKWEGKAMHDF